MWLKSNDYDLEKEVLFITKDKRFRIIRTTDNDYNLADACQHFFSAKDRPDTPEHKLKKQEQDFRKKFENFGAVIIRLEELELEGHYSLVDSCGGFVGWENFNNNHYYIKELKELANKIIFDENNFETKQKKLEDEQKFIADELSKFIDKCEKNGIDADYTAYLAFCIIGGTTFRKSPKHFYSSVSEIISKNWP